ncbi:glycosyl transferase [Enterobacter asburiae]|nr:glycosyl transferase [Enterobacter asburiae]
MNDGGLLSQIADLQKTPVPDVINFIWIGDINKLNKQYIYLWAETNKDKDICLWYDDRSGKYVLLHNAIRDYVEDNFFDDQHEVEKNIRNKAFSFIYPKVVEGFSLEDLVLFFLKENKIPYNEDIKINYSSKLEFSNVKIKKITDVFAGKFDVFMKYYYYELILRGNFASASDIVRLLIIYRYGGIYIDVDVLPNINNIFKKSNAFMEKENYTESHSIRLFKTITFLKRNSSKEFERDELKLYSENINNLGWVHIDKLLSLIEKDVEDFNIVELPPLGDVCVYKDLLLIGSDKSLNGIYFNCFIASHPKSKIVSIILRTMAKRYSFLEKNNAILDFYKGKNNSCYLSRLLPWRSELITKNYCVTSILTGPGLLVEVLLGLAYSIFKINESINPSYIAELMQNNTFGIAFFNINLDTPEGIYSTWRK